MARGNEMLVEGGKRMNEQHLSAQELLAAIRCCKYYDGTDTCMGCPNAVPGTADLAGMCKCRFDVYDEMIRILEGIIGQS